jgi:hypothetical protein
MVPCRYRNRVGVGFTMGQSRSPGSTLRPVQPPTSNAISQRAKTLTAPPLVLALNMRTLGTGRRALSRRTKGERAASEWDSGMGCSSSGNARPILEASRYPYVVTIVMDSVPVMHSLSLAGRRLFGQAKVRLAHLVLAIARISHLLQSRAAGRTAPTAGKVPDK